MKEEKAKKPPKAVGEEQNMVKAKEGSKNTEAKGDQEKVSNTRTNNPPPLPPPKKNKDLSKMPEAELTTRNRPKTEKTIIAKSTAYAYLQHKYPTVSRVNDDGEYEIIPSKDARKGDTVYIATENNVLVETKVV